ncbi:MAG: hypothetical protein Q8L75_18545 [Acidobacteriota bacterium]|nr:hypothetical protein [Acidobacteriota bacterium]
MAKKTSKSKAKGRAAAKPAKTVAKKPVKQAVKKPAKKKVAKKKAAVKRKPAAGASDELYAPILGAERRYLGRVQLEVVRAGAARVKRMIYPPGFKWSVDMQPAVGTALCMHAHVGYLAHGEIHIEYADGCVVEFKAPQVVAIDPGHDGWVVGTEPVVLIEFDFERDTVARMGMPNSHRHE